MADGRSGGANAPLPSPLRSGSERRSDGHPSAHPYNSGSLKSERERRRGGDESREAVKMEGFSICSQLSCTGGRVTDNGREAKEMR